MGGVVLNDSRKFDTKYLEYNKYAIMRCVRKVEQELKITLYIRWYIYTSLAANGENVIKMIHKGVIPSFFSPGARVRIFTSLEDLFFLFFFFFFKRFPNAFQMSS